MLAFCFHFRRDSHHFCTACDFVELLRLPSCLFQADDCECVSLNKIFLPFSYSLPLPHFPVPFPATLEWCQGVRQNLYIMFKCRSLMDWWSGVNVVSVSVPFSRFQIITTICFLTGPECRVIKQPSYYLSVLMTGSHLWVIMVSSELITHAVI